MSRKMNGAGLFLAGTAFGALLVLQYAKRKYAQIAREEIDSVRRAFHDFEAARSAEAARQKERNEYADVLRRAGYADSLDTVEAAEGKEEPAVTDTPYVISPNEFGEREDYDTVSLICYADNQVADDNDELLEDVEGTIGADSLTHFGEYEDDSVFVRNDRLKCDYEILRDMRRYSDVIRNGPRRVRYDDMY